MCIHLPQSNPIKNNGDMQIKENSINNLFFKLLNQSKKNIGTIDKVNKTE
jgi:hypothetical protein